jgi:serine/threonine protein kinase
MGIATMNERQIFNNALGIENTAERSAYLNQACAGDAALRENVQGLLEAHEQLGSFLVSTPVAAAGTTDGPRFEQPGSMIGPYKLLQQIGEGGFGVVYMAEQT